jgi:hypothetical protein
MRVKYGELSRGELRAREYVQARAREAWERLRDGEQELAAELLDELDERIALELVEAPDSARVAELIVDDVSAWPLAELILAQAPADVGCALSFGRAPLSLELALAEVREAHDVDLQRARVRAGFGRGHLLELTLAVPGGHGSEIEQNAAENLVRALVGDRLFETWIGAVHVTAAPRGGSLRVLDVNAPKQDLSLLELLPTVTAAALGVLQGLPEARWSSRPPAAVASTSPVSLRIDDVARDARSSSAAAANEEDAHGDWTLLEMEPASEAGELDKSDLVLASTCTPELLRCYLEGSPCASQRFACDGERFVYVGYIDEERGVSRRVARRTEIESALSNSLADCAVVSGVGLGVTSTYVDLALFNLETGLPRLVSKLRELGLPRRTTLRFFDSELANECVSIWPDTDNQCP